MDALRRSSAFIKHIATHSENLVTFYHQLATIGVIDLWRWTRLPETDLVPQNRLVGATLAPAVVLHLPPAGALHATCAHERGSRTCPQLPSFALWNPWNWIVVVCTDTRLKKRSYHKLEVVVAQRSLRTHIASGVLTSLRSWAQDNLYCIEGGTLLVYTGVY